MTLSSNMLVYKYKFRPATSEDGVKFAKNLRPIDQLEVTAISGLPAGDAIPLAVRTAIKAQVVIDDNGSMHYLWGLSAHWENSHTGIPWMLATTHAVFPRREFLVRSREIVNSMQKRYARLWNFVHLDNKPAKRWLARLGFKFSRTPTIFRSEPFIEFTRSRNVHPH